MSTELPQRELTLEGTVSFTKFFDPAKMKAVLEKYSPKSGSNWFNQMHIIGACLGDSQARVKSWELRINQDSGDYSPVDADLVRKFLFDLKEKDLITGHSLVSLTENGVISLE